MANKLSLSLTVYFVTATISNHLMFSAAYKLRPVVTFLAAGRGVLTLFLVYCKTLSKLRDARGLCGRVS